MGTKGNCTLFGPLTLPCSLLSFQYHFGLLLMLPLDVTLAAGSSIDLFGLVAPALAQLYPNSSSSYTLAASVTADKPVSTLGLSSDAVAGVSKDSGGFRSAVGCRYNGVVDVCICCVYQGTTGGIGALVLSTVPFHCTMAFSTWAALCFLTSLQSRQSKES